MSSSSLTAAFSPLTFVNSILYFLNEGVRFVSDRKIEISFSVIPL